MPRPDETPSTVTVAVSAGVAPLPLLLFYAAIFILHGYFLPVEDPEVTTTRAGEGLAGLVASAFLVFLVFGLWRFTSARGRVLFLVGQLIVLAADIFFLFDETSGDRRFPVVLVLSSTVALVFALRRPSSDWVQDRLTVLVDRRAAGARRPAVAQDELPSDAPLA